MNDRGNRIFKTFSLVACSALAIFGAVGFWEGFQQNAIFELVFSGTILINYFTYLISGNIRWNRQVLIASVFAVMIFLLITGGIAETGIFWLLMFPAAVFLLSGIRSGLVWTILLFIATLGIAFLSYFGQLNLLYSFVEVRQMLGVFAVISVLIYVYEKNRIKSETAVLMSQARLRALYEITTHGELKLPDQFRAALKLGSETLGTKIAVLSHIEKEQFTVEYCVADGLKEGDVFPLAETYCDITVKKGDVLSIDHMKTDEHKAHVCYQKFNLEAYIGVPVDEFGNLHGTLAFMAPDPHHPSFSDSDRDFVRLMGKWMGAMLERASIDKMKSEFVSVASHQLRTPLTGIKWFSELMLAGKAGALADQQKDFLKDIHESNERMLKLVEDLLNVSRIETGTKFEIKKAPADIISIIDSLAVDLVGLAHKHEVTLKKSDAVPRTLMLPIDADKIRQVFANLMSNAVKYSKLGGTVTVDFKEKPGQTILLSFIDTGLGIPEKQQGRMFEKFFRADNVQTAETDGTGLGLYIAKAIVEGHGGKIWFESKENEGTIFFVELPKN